MLVSWLSARSLLPYPEEQPWPLGFQCLAPAIGIAGPVPRAVHAFAACARPYRACRSHAPTCLSAGARSTAMRPLHSGDDKRRHTICQHLQPLPDCLSRPATNAPPTSKADSQNSISIPVDDASYPQESRSFRCGTGPIALADPSRVPYLFYMGTARFDTVGDFFKYKVDVAIRCDNCRRKRILTAEQVEAIFGLGTRIVTAERRLRCSHCKAKGGRLAPIPRLEG